MEKGKELLYKGGFGERKINKKKDNNMRERTSLKSNEKKAEAKGRLRNRKKGKKTTKCLKPMDGNQNNDGKSNESMKKCENRRKLRRKNGRKFGKKRFRSRGKLRNRKKNKEIDENNQMEKDRKDKDKESFESGINVRGKNKLKFGGKRKKAWGKSGNRMKNMKSDVEEKQKNGNKNEPRDKDMERLKNRTNMREKTELKSGEKEENRTKGKLGMKNKNKQMKKKRKNRNKKKSKNKDKKGRYGSRKKMRGNTNLKSGKKEKNTRRRLRNRIKSKKTDVNKQMKKEDNTGNKYESKDKGKGGMTNLMKSKNEEMKKDHKNGNIIISTENAKGKLRTGMNMKKLRTELKTRDKEHISKGSHGIKMRMNSNKHMNTEQFFGVDSKFKGTGSFGNEIHHKKGTDLKPEKKEYMSEGIYGIGLKNNKMDLKKGMENLQKQINWNRPRNKEIITTQINVDTRGRIDLEPREKGINNRRIDLNKQTIIDEQKLMHMKRPKHMGSISNQMYTAERTDLNLAKSENKKMDVNKQMKSKEKVHLVNRNRLENKGKLGNKVDRTEMPYMSSKVNNKITDINAQMEKGVIRHGNHMGAAERTDMKLGKSENKKMDLNKQMKNKEKVHLVNRNRLENKGKLGNKVDRTEMPYMSSKVNNKITDINAQMEKGVIRHGNHMGAAERTDMKLGKSENKKMDLNKQMKNKEKEHLVNKNRSENKGNLGNKVDRTEMPYMSSKVNNKKTDINAQMEKGVTRPGNHMGTAERKDNKKLKSEKNPRFESLILSDTLHLLLKPCNHVQNSYLLNLYNTGLHLAH